MMFVIVGSTNLLLLFFSVVYLAHSQQATCPTSEQRKLAQQVVTASFSDFVVINTFTNHPCGPGNWTRIVNLNFSDPSQQCPPNMALGRFTPRRVCGIGTDVPACSSTMFDVQGIQYDHVCGRIIGYQFGLTDAFDVLPIDQPVSIDGHYVDGVSLTHGINLRTHIWTFASARDEVGQFPFTNCPCTNITQASMATPPPSFVGNDYFCDTGSTNSAHLGPAFYVDDPLWDGAGCGSNNTCCSLNSPPWFSKKLPSPTVDDIEMRICRDQHQTDENIHIEIVELYIR